MGRRVSALWRAALAGTVGLWLAVLPVAAVAQVRVTLDDARLMAANLLSNDQPRAALALADGVLMGAPGDVPALLLKSRALRDLGQPGEALKFARAGWNAAPHDRDRFFAALAAAQARASAGQNGMAQLWLRRAANVAPDDNLKAIAVRDFREVRSRTPWRLRFNAFAAPSSNINGAPKSNRMTFAGLQFVNPSAVPLSGLRFGAEADASVIVPLSDRARLHFGGVLYRERVALSQDARDKVPAARNADYARDLIELRADYEHRAADGRWLLKTGVRLGREWRGGALFSTAQSVVLRFGHAFGDGYKAGIKATATRDIQQQARLRDSDSVALGGYLSRTLGNGAVLRLDVKRMERDSDSAAVAEVAREATLSYSAARPVWGMVPRFSLGWAARDFDRALYGPQVRRDRSRSASATVILPKLDYFGFAPEIGVTWRDTTSNYSLFESESIGLRLGLRSVF